MKNKDLYTDVQAARNIYWRERESKGLMITFEGWLFQPVDYSVMTSDRCQACRFF